MSTGAKRYPFTFKQADRLWGEPDRVSDRRQLPAWAAAHEGKRVICRFISLRGNHRKRNQETFVYGTLVGKTDTGYTIRCQVTREEITIHYKRIVAMAAPKDV